ncbi:MAG: GNAT family N-acetyltransferase [Anaerolineales bacterium]|nr:GNAT family N-acetyltransferase [Chloroflexota bacterium]MBL6979819.1 GNAT family N-acetyltransferase [Anaerolineales bacterium]
MKDSTILLKPITAEQTLQLRRDVLRPGAPLSAAISPADDNTEVYHAGAFIGDELVGIATVYMHPSPDGEHLDAWRLRGMAVREELRGQGIGRLALQNCIDHIALQGGTYLWCNARTPVVDFYHKLGFETVGKEFHKPRSGPHYVMVRSIPLFPIINTFDS